jgi:tetratricopeptide (TPR) repeat protein
MNSNREQPQTKFDELVKNTWIFVRLLCGLAILREILIVFSARASLRSRLDPNCDRAQPQIRLLLSEWTSPTPGRNLRPGRTAGMRRFIIQNPRLSVILAVTFILVGGAAAILWGKSLLVPDLIAEATAAYGRQDWMGTELLARKRLKHVPDDSKASQLAARAAARQDRDQAAIAIYSRLILEQMDAEDLFLLGRALNRTRKADLAFKTFEQSRLANPNHPETLNALAELYLQNDRESAAEVAAERLARQPGWEARGFLILGAARAALHDPAGAAEALNRFFELDPEGRAAAPRPVRPLRLLLARSLLESVRPAEARHLLVNLIAHGPDAEASWLLSRTYIQEHDWDRAAPLFESSASFSALQLYAFEPAPYVGAARCGTCHSEIYRSFIASTHATTFSRPQDLDKLALPPNAIPDPGNPQVTHEFERLHGSLTVETKSANEVQRAVIDYAFGSRDHFMTFVGRDEDGKSRMIRISHFQSARGSGWDLATGLPVQPDDPHEYLGTTLLEGDGVRRCLFCHTTNFRDGLDETGPESKDRAIGCEKCHGPGGNHVAAAEAGFSDLAILNPGRLQGPALNKTCGQCHDLHGTSVISAPRTDPVWYRFQSLALTWSRCYTESADKLTCVTCHDPHNYGKISAARQEAKCLSCHGPDRVPASTAAMPRPDSLAPVGEQVAEGRVRGSTDSRILPAEKPTERKNRSTCPIDPAKGCIECHMPSAWQQSTHSFKTDHYIRVRDRPGPEK